MLKMTTRIIVGFLLFASAAVWGQQATTISYPLNEVDYTSISAKGTPQIVADKFLVFEMDVTSIISSLESQKLSKSAGDVIGKIALPHPNGQIHEYDVRQNTTMSEGLQNKFPMIRSYDGFNPLNGAKVKWDVTPHGLHAMIMVPDQPTIYIDPIFQGNTEYYIVYSKNDFQSNKIKECLFESEAQGTGKPSIEGTSKSYLTCELRTYRLALAATVEYTNFHGGTKALSQAAQVTTMNRVNGVFERDLTLTMTIIPNNDLIVYAGATNSDPYTNGDPGAMINENQTNLDNVIGTANYDIGHVFGTNSGGLAGLGVICVGGQKARGVTGSAAPIGDPFDIDYVAHELGHQYGANHTQNNNCNRNNATAMEPGSASTILGYAGICNPNVQNNSDDHFHAISLQEMGNRITNTNCAVITPLANSAPQIISTNGNVTIPAGTPFALTAEVIDADGDVLSYCWEQMDNQISTQPPVSTSTGGPNFRSNSPILSPTRYFPNLTALAAGGPFTWEVIPTVSRTMNFRVSVRDQPLGVAGCNDFENATVTTDAASGPFVVLYPSATGIIWNAGTTETVTWDVANTDVAPVSCSNVDIYLSTNGGNSYPTLLADNVPNTGFANVTVPNVGTTTARIMVISSTGTFFDISNNNFEIVELSFDYTLNVTPTSIEVCQPTSAVYTVDIGSVDGYNDPVTLSVTGVPAGATATFSANPVTPAGTSLLTISNTNLALPGTYTLTIEANSTTGIKTQNVELIILSNTPSPVTLVSPTNGEVGTNLPTLFTWTAGSGNGVTYQIEISTDAAFTAIVDQAAGLANTNYTSTVLNQGVEYFWRVRYTNACATSDWSTTFSFTTTNCTIYNSANVPVTIPTVGTVTSTITIPPSGNILDVNLTNMTGTHTRVGQLTFTLTSPQGTTVTLMNQVCGNNANFNIGFDDDAASAVIPCPPTNGNLYQPQGLLADFNGQDPTGVWTLTIIDNTNPFGGELQAWSLEICSAVSTGCTEPDLATTSGNASICEGDNATITVTGGNLNDATDWQWYEGTCGGTPIAAGTSLNVSPTVTTSYFVRGEGGCATPGACAEVVITVNPTYNETDAVTICNGNIYVFGTQTLTTAGTYTEVFTSAGGCDSTVVLTLNVNPTYNETDAATICDGNSYIFGTQTLTTSGTYTEVFTAANGCDSTVVLTLNVNPTYNETDAATICDGNSYIFGTQTLTTSGTYTEVFTSAGGCDSTVVLTLNVVTGFNETDAATICDGNSYIFGTQTLTASGTYTEVFTAAGGCDSTVVLTLNVVTGFNETDAATICNGDTYIFGTQTLTTAGTYTEVFSSVAGCDSTVILTLNVVTGFNETDAATICNGDTYVFGTQTLTAAGTYTEVFTAANGCDSTVVLTLDVNPALNTTDEASICNGDTYIFGTQTLTTSGTFTEVFTSAAGCDSIVVLTLNVVPGFNETDEATICVGDSYVFGTQTLTTAGTYTEVFTSLGGCDSTVVLTLNVGQSYNTTTSATICSGDTYVFGALTLTNAGAYTQIFNSVEGCDSVVVLTLNVLDNYTTSVDAIICEGNSYTFPDGTIGTTAQTQTSVLTSVNGCDSTIITNLMLQNLDISVTQSGATLIANQTSATYQWIDCDNNNEPIIGEIGTSFTPTVNGNYAVIVTSGNCTDTSACYLIDLSSLDQFIADQLNVFPNPTNGHLTLEWSGKLEKIEIRDAIGRLVYQQANDLSNQQAIDISHVERGVYFIHLFHGEGVHVVEVVKH
jgi:subtilisin-like proprotein convertase family protein